MKIIIDYRYIQGSGKEGFFRGEVKKKVETVRFENTKYGFLLYGEEDGMGLESGGGARNFYFSLVQIIFG